MSYNRAVSNEFFRQLKEGILAPLVARIKADDTLMLALRGSYINIYYRGGALLKVEEKGSSYIASFDTKYNTDGDPLSEFPVVFTGANDVARLIGEIPRLKYVMDKFFSKKRKSEREFQQLVARENNNSQISNETEYFIVDIEVAGIVSNARFDMLAVRWLRDERKKKGCLVPVVIEMKYGIHALDGDAGLEAHLGDVERVFGGESAGVLDDLRRGLQNQLAQTEQLGLLEFNKSGRIEALEVDFTARPEFIIMLANYNPASTKLSKFLGGIDWSPESAYDLLFHVSSFAGYGMHRACMLNLAEFKVLADKFHQTACRGINKKI